MHHQELVQLVWWICEQSTNWKNGQDSCVLVRWAYHHPKIGKNYLALIGGRTMIQRLVVNVMHLLSGHTIIK